MTMTPKEQRIWEATYASYFVAYVQKHGHTPDIKAIADAVAVADRAVVSFKEARETIMENIGIEL
jgi:hypothetical protein